MSSSPWIDRAVVAAADHLYLLHLRRGGNLEPVIRRRMAELTAENDPCVSIFANDRCIAPPLAAELVTVGGRLWKPAIEQTPDGERPDGERPGQCGRGPLPVPGAAVAYPPSSPAAVLGWQEFRAARAEEPWPYLTHCTRAPSGRWPDQTESDYLDELLRGECAERSALAALCRILMQQRIWGTKSALRGGFSAVCLTEVSPAELSALRQYQPQRLRWDFEPYAVAILRDWLAERGARPVQYGDERTWEQLPEADRPFFQIKETRRRRRPMSWSREREWRLPGDLELSALPSDAACVLVPSFKEAERVAPMSRWPIVVCPGG